MQLAEIHVIQCECGETGGITKLSGERGGRGLVYTTVEGGGGERERERERERENVL